MFSKNSILFKSLIIYLIYVFFFAIILFSVQKPKNKYEKFVSIEEKDHIDNNDRVSLIESGEDAIFVRLNMLENAKHSIDISYYTLTEGRSVDLVLASLLEAADRNVQVRIILDGVFYNLSGEWKAVRYAFSQHPNIEFKLYEPFKILKPRVWNDRLHDKLIIVDNELVLIGGRNIGDKYFDKDSDTSQYSKDRDVIVYNPDPNDLNSSVLAISNYFQQVFTYKHSKLASSDLSQRKINKGQLISKKLKVDNATHKAQYQSQMQPIDWLAKTQKTNGVDFVYNPIGRGNQNPVVLQKLLSLADSSKESVVIQSPYVILSRNIKHYLKDYNLKLNKVKVLTNSMASSPNPIAYAGYDNSRKTLIDSGITIYEHQGPESLHGKSYVYDSKISAVGSFNFDARSSFINSEVMVIIYSKDFANKLMSHINSDLDNSLKVENDLTYKKDDVVKPAKISFLKKVLIKILVKVVYFLDYLL